MFRLLWLFIVMTLALAGQALAVDLPMMDHGGGHLMDMTGRMVMGQNTDKLPGGCKKISQEVELTVRAGRKYAKSYPGTMFGFDKHEWRFEPCTKLTITFINDDKVRHQWMMHGLPKYLYPRGMFHLEVTGRGQVTGTLILPKEDMTYLVHCDIAQHMEKGMKAQLIVGDGSEDLPSIPGVTAFAIADDYSGSAGEMPQPLEPESSTSLFSGVLIIGLAIGLFGTPFAARVLRDRFKDMTAKDIMRYLANLATNLINSLIKAVIWLAQLITAQTQKYLPRK